MFLTRKRESLQKLVGDYSGVDTALFRLDTLPEQFLKNPTLIRTIELFAAAGYPRPDDLVELKELANRRWMVKDRKNKRIFEIRVFQDAVIVHAHLARDVNANMSIQLLRPRGRSVTIYSERENNWKPDQIRRIDLADRIVSENGGKIAEISSETRIESGDAVNVTITINNSDEEQSVTSRLNVVETSTLPPPSAAYALFHTRDGDGYDSRPGKRGVNVPHFAWSPKPQRVELVNPDDLKGAIVTRRAIFQWSHTIRNGDSAEYAIQKTSGLGETHMPTLSD